jgi:hypothetical protein
MHMQAQAITTEIQEINDFLKKKIDRGEFIFNDELNELLARLLELVKKVASFQNPELAERIQEILSEIENSLFD